MNHYDKTAKEAIMRLNPYLNFNGQCEAAFQLYQKVLNGKNLQMFRFADMPPSDEMPIPVSARQQIMHASDVPPVFSSNRF